MTGDPQSLPPLSTPDPYDSVETSAARAVIDEHYDVGADLYKFWGSPLSVLRAIALGWPRSRHPAQFHYAWDLGPASVDAGIRETTRRAIALLDLEGVARPRLYDPGCGIGGGVTQVAHMLPQATVIGVSLGQRQLAIGRMRARAEGVAERSGFVRGNYLQAPFADATFDGIYTLESLVHTPAPERARLLRELYRVLKPGRTFVSFEGFRLREPRTVKEQGLTQDVMDGWTLPLPPLPGEFRGHAEAAGFMLLQQEDATAHIYAAAKRIAGIATAVLLPLATIARIPLLGGLVAPLGFVSPRAARRFVDACRSQVEVFNHGLGAYYVHVFRKPC